MNMIAMRKIFLLISVITVISGCASVKMSDVSGIIIQESEAEWTTVVSQGKYRVLNNVWNKGAATGTGYQKVFLEKLNGAEAFGWQWRWSSQGSVVTYPEVIYGDKPWDMPSGMKSEFPFAAGTKKITADFNISLRATGTYNMAFSLWAVTDPSSPKETISHEIMIWNVNSFMTPAGSLKDSIVVDGVNYKMYARIGHGDASGGTSHTWTYVAFVAERPVLKGPLDIGAFVGHLVKKGILTEKNYITSVELGNEVVNGSGCAEISDYSITVK
jgi:hypothetical protein